MALAGLILGIVAIVLSFFGGTLWFLPLIALPVAIVGLVLSVVARKKEVTGVATAGLVVGIIAVVITAIFFITCSICYICAAAFVNELVENADEGSIQDALNEFQNAIESVQ